MQVVRRTSFVAIVLMLFGTSAHAQAGRADLRYAAPLPELIVFTTLDTMNTTMTGMPTGDMTTSGALRTVTEVRIAPAAAGFAVTATLRQMTGAMSTPMGEMPMNLDEGPSVEFMITERGASPDAMADSPAGMQAMGASAPEMIGSARVAGALMALPGRELRIGESWSDTTHMSPTHDGITVEMTMVNHGTYAGDTVVDGRTLNVLRMTGELTSKTTGTVQGMDMTQTMTSTSTETVLWDSARHVPLYRDALNDTRNETLMPQQGMTLRMNARTRSITTAEPQG